MKAARAIAAVAALVTCSRCATDPVVQSTGSDTYVVSVRARSSHAGVLVAQNAALQDARAFCTGLGKRFTPLADRVVEGVLASSVTYTIQFRCPAPNSPDLPKPTVNQSPDDVL